MTRNINLITQKNNERNDFKMNITSIEKKNISVKEVARIMGKHEQFVRIGLQNGTLPFGVAEKLPGSSRYSYHISPKLFFEYIGTEGLQT